MSMMFRYIDEMDVLDKFGRIVAKIEHSLPLI